MRYKDTRADDTLIGTIADDLFRLSRGGVDRVDGGGGFDRLEVDYHKGRLTEVAYNEVYIAADGSLSGRLIGTIGEHGWKTWVTFTDIDQLAFTASGGTDNLAVHVHGQVSDRTFSVDLGADGYDTLRLFFDDVRAQISGANGAITTNIGTFAGIEHVVASLSEYDDIANLGTSFGSLKGNGGNDTLTGSNGVDFIAGGKGADVLAGGSGADSFYYDGLRDSPAAKADTILDFSHGEGDFIALHVDADKAVLGRQRFAFIDQQQFTGPGGTQGELRQQDNGDGTVTLQGDVNHDGIADFAILVHTDTLLVLADLRI